LNEKKGREKKCPVSEKKNAGPWVEVKHEKEPDRMRFLG